MSVQVIGSSRVRTSSAPTLNAHRSFDIYAQQYLSTCRSSARVAPEDASVAVPSAAFGGPDAASVTATAPLVPDAAPSFSTDDWLREHGNLRLPRDAACGTGAFDGCWCVGSLQVAGVGELLVCTRPRDSAAPSVPAVMHTVLYAIRGGSLRAVLDVPTQASCTWEYAKGPTTSAALRPVVDGADLVLEDAAAPCERALADATREQLLPERAVLASVCAARGRYRWQNGRFVKHPS